MAWESASPCAWLTFSQESVIISVSYTSDNTWRVHYAFFARAGFTAAARREAAAHETLLVDLATLDGDLRQEATL